MMRRTALLLAAALSATAISTEAAAVGEKVNGFPTWAERVHHELTNRARVDPQVEMNECGSACAEASCYSPMPPLYYKHELNRAARFHADHQTKNGYFDHTSSCTLVSNIDQLYPGQCDGSASCSCVGGTNSCSSTCTSAQQRVSLFNTSYAGEIIASGGSPLNAFYLWLYEDAGGDPSCQFTLQNGHRWLILTSSGAVGFGVSGYHVGDFGGGGDQHPIASGAHWPQGGSSVEAWANWYDSAAPKSAMINVEGTCQPMQLGRGTADNGAYMANLTGLSGCNRYFFVFRDASDQLVTYPETGSLGIGQPGSCPDWSTERPATGPSCNCVPQCNGKECGGDTCGGSCGSCGSGESCVAGACMSDGSSTGGGGSTATGGSGSTGGSTSIGGSDAGGGDASGGSDATGGTDGGPSGDDDADSEQAGGCSVSAATERTPIELSWLLAAGLALGRRPRRR